jgi:hypothetical protein
MWRRRTAYSTSAWFLRSPGDTCHFGTAARDPTGTGHPTLPSLLHSLLLTGIHQSFKGEGTAYSDLYPSKFLILLSTAVLNFHSLHPSWDQIYFLRTLIPYNCNCCSSSIFQNYTVRCQWLHTFITRVTTGNYNIYTDLHTTDRYSKHYDFYIFTRRFSITASSIGDSSASVLTSSLDGDWVAVHSQLQLMASLTIH